MLWTTHVAGLAGLGICCSQKEAGPSGRLAPALLQLPPAMSRPTEPKTKSHLKVILRIHSENHRLRPASAGGSCTPRAHSAPRAFITPYTHALILRSASYSRRSACRCSTCLIYCRPWIPPLVIPPQHPPPPMPPLASHAPPPPPPPLVAPLLDVVPDVADTSSRAALMPSCCGDRCGYSAARSTGGTRRRRISGGSSSSSGCTPPLPSSSAR